MFLHFRYILHNGDDTCMDVWSIEFANNLLLLFIFLHLTQNGDDFGFFPIISCKFCTYMKAHCDYNVVDAIGLITNVR
jgi:hypothetical protein